MSGPRIQYRTYSGAAPYGFISYAHRDEARVLPVVGALDGDRYRLWYDGGIEAGANWPEVVASHLKGAGAAVFFLTAAFLRSQNCVREVHYAVAERQRLILVYLEKVSLPDELSLQFSTASVIHGEAEDALQIAREIEALLGESFRGDGVTGYEAVAARRRRGNGWRVASLVFAGLFLLAVLFSVGYLGGYFPFLGARPGIATPASGANDDGEPLQVKVFKDSRSRDILLRAYEGAALYLCGDRLVTDPEAIRCGGGSWYVGEEPVASGWPDVLEVVTAKKEVTCLALVDQGIEDFSPLAQMPQLEYLDISGNPVRDLSFLVALPALRTLKLMDIGGADVAPLKDLPALKTVYVRYDDAAAVLAVLGDRAVDVIVRP